MPRVYWTEGERERAANERKHANENDCFVDQVYTVMRKKRMTQKDVADAAGVSLSSVQKMLREPDRLQLCMLRQICDVLGFSLEPIYKGSA